MEALSPASRGRMGRPLRFVLSSAHVRYLIAVFISLLIHWTAFSLLTANILLDDATGRVEGADLVVYLDASAKPALLANSPGGREHASDRVPPLSVAGSSHDSGLAIFSSYFPIRELDAAPAIVRDIDVSSEEIKRRPTDGGQVILRLWIDEAGHIVRVEPISSDMPSIYSETAVRAFMEAEFYPGIKDGKPVRSRINVVLFYPAVP